MIFASIHDSKLYSLNNYTEECSFQWNTEMMNERMTPQVVMKNDAEDGSMKM